MYRTGLIAALVLGSACKKDPGPEARTEAAGAIQAKASADLVWAASGVVRVVDPAQGRVVQSVEIGHPITSIVFPPSGDVAWIGTSEGLFRADAAAGTARGPLTRYPIRRLELDARGEVLSILQHEVIVAPDGTRDIKPFRLVRFDTVKEKIVSDEEIGQRIHYAADDGKSFIVVTERGDVLTGARPEELSSGRPLQLRSLVGGPGPFRLRGDMTVSSGGKAYLAIEGVPAHVLVLDVATGIGEAIDLERETAIRGLALLPDGRTLFVNAMHEVLLVDLGAKKVRASLALPGAHMGASISSDGRTMYLAQTVEGDGGAITAVRLDPLAIAAHVHIDDISPWAIAARPSVRR